MPHTVNTIVGGFAGDGETSSAHKRYACHILNIEDLSNYVNGGEMKISRVEIAFSEKDVVNIHPYNDDPMVIIVTCDE